MFREQLLHQLDIDDYASLRPPDPIIRPSVCPEGLQCFQDKMDIQSLLIKTAQFYTGSVSLDRNQQNCCWFWRGAGTDRRTDGPNQVPFRVLCYVHYYY